MQKRILITVVTISLSSILLMGLLQVNQSKATSFAKSSVQVADGIPMPPPPPGKKPGTVVMADGIPMPPPPPGKKPGTVVLAASMAGRRAENGWSASRSGW